MAKVIKAQDPTAKTIFIGPCTAKKREFQREEYQGLVDSVLTFEELQALIDSKNIDAESLEELNMDQASYFGRNFARSGGVAQAVEQALKENGIDFELKPVVCDGIEQCKIALIRKNKNLLDANFIEGMACAGGCIGGAGCLTHSGKNKAEFEKYSNNAKPKSIKESVSNAKDTKN